MEPAPSDARLSRYRIDRLLGAGGMGSVYLARDLSLNRPVAIKFISDEKAADPAARRRLLREARAAAALDHPNICSVYEVLDDDRPCIVMQYVEGETLASTLRGGRLDVRLALSITADIAAALSVAHAHNVIHRDLKPQNIIITADHRAKLLDFGVARYTDPAEPSDDVTTASRLTETGDTPGTPPYMSPEQVHGRVLDARSDLFALGAVLFECLTGQRAFKGRNGLEVAAQILSYDPPPVSTLRPELGKQHDELCKKLLAKNPRDRYSSADEVLGVLQLLSTGTSRQALTGELPRKRGWPRAVLAAAGVAIVAAAIGYFAVKWRSAPTMPRDPQAA
jgi:eukaryotic-like serine/threonine-protein kinase